MIKLRHSGIVVEDAERSVVFYRDHLGLEVIDDRQEGGEYLETLLGLPGVCARTVKLRGEGAGIIELLEFQGVKPDNRARPVGLLGFGPTHIALTVDDLDTLYFRLLKHGIHFVSPPTISPDGKVKLLFCRDPDGAYLELVQEM